MISLFLVQSLRNTAKILILLSTLIASSSQQENHSDDMNSYNATEKSGDHSTLQNGIILLLYIIGVLYMLLSTFIICHKYFVPVLQIFVKYHKFAGDVVGATFMAIGLSFFGLVSAILHVFVSSDDASVSDIFASAAFKVTVIPGICSLLSGTKVPLRLRGWAVFRDLKFHLVGSAVFACMAIDSQMHWWEGVVLLLIYTGYLIVLKFDGKIRCEGGGTERQVDTGVCTNVQVDEEVSNSVGNFDISWPKESTLVKKVCYLVCFPVVALLHVTLPNVQTTVGKKVFVWAYVGSIIWIGLFSSYLTWWGYMVWGTIGVQGEIIPILESLPLLISCVIAGRMGFGEMAVAAVIGVNIFNICLGLGVPILITGVVQDSVVRVNAKGMLCYAGILSGILILFVVIVIAFRWRMNKCFGTVMLVLYFVALAAFLSLEFDLITCPG